MDGFSSAASGLAVVSLGLQLAGGLIKLYDFWGTVRDAPQEVGEILLDLKLLSRILDELIKRKDPSPHIKDALDCCNDKVAALHSIVREFEPNFSSSKPHIRLWTKFKAAHKRQKLKRFRDSLQETKATLLLALLPQLYVVVKSFRQFFPWKTHIDCSEAAPEYIEEIQTGNQDPTKNAKSYQANESKSSPEFNIRSESDLPQYSEIRDSSFDPPEEGIFHAGSKFHIRQLPPDVPASALQASIEGAFQVAAEKYFRGGAFARAMNDTIQRVATIQTSYRYNQGSDDSDSVAGRPDVTLSYSSSTKGHGSIHSVSQVQRPSQSRICHRTSATGTLFGTIWVRKTSVRVDSLSGKNVDIVSSFTFFPSWWLTGFGLKYGMEANLCSTSVGWQFNFNPIRAVSQESPIFKFCKSGNLQAVQQLIADGSASVRDTSPKGWTPLHFAATAENTNVPLCEFLISAGADKTALAYEGPTDGSLSPVTMFAATSKKKPADRKIAMLRLFEDCMDLSEPSSEGWTVLADLVRSFNQESVPQTQNSVNWFLRSLKAESMVAFGPKTMWHGLQHAVRSLVDLEHKNMLVASKLGLKGAGGAEQQTPTSHGMAIAYWIVLRATGKQLLPMLVAAGAIMHIEGYDYDPDTEVDPAVLGQQLPFLYSEWSKALTKSIETVDKVMSSELDAALEEAGWTQDSLGELITNAGKPDLSKERCHQMCCSVCGDDYSLLGVGLVEPRWIEFTECTSSNHKSNCICPEFLQSQGRLGHCEQPPGYESDDCQSDSDEENEIYHDAGSHNTTTATTTSSQQECDSGDIDWTVKCQEFIRKIEGKKKDPFSAVAALLYRAQARLWVERYGPGELLCGTCFLRREGYLDGEARDDDDIFASMPASFCS
ncbi:hypothetical protein EPUS_01619 [Endocarpon pusillum Z07020]|uniref:Uncharacterized protein n=1 Tax=Endocarpon pusillum (strain Z07020 / HMAS-L-300199) TaxID=1263415 RepID=U1I1J1_ENDPU|nr:uncharacterized protein EPUS_01619 [Endocarpon pusillum Z07020]ERF75789.1 hypothetical protein EPUS_01619 [Endocarpon pusillum Z07020]